MNGYILFILLALVAGFAMPTQAGINAQLNLWTKSSVLAAAISFAVGTLVLVVYAGLLRLPLPPIAGASAQPWWAWTGGALGAFFVAATIIIAPKLGATTMVALVLAGQLVASLALDHFGWLGYPVHPVSLGRIAGVALVAVGAWMVRYF